MSFVSRPLSAADLSSLTVGQRLRLSESVRLSFAPRAESEVAIAAHFSPCEAISIVTGAHLVPSTAGGFVVAIHGRHETASVLLVWRDGAAAPLQAGVAPMCGLSLFRTAHPTGRFAGEAKPGGAPAAKAKGRGKARPAARPAAPAAAPAAASAVASAVSDAITRALEGMIPAAPTVDLSPLEARLEALETLLAAPTGATVRSRVALAAASAANPLVAKLQRFGYTPGRECPANVLLAAPPSLGKTFAVRELGKAYDLFVEHGCSDDLDEVPTLLGSATPDGAGGFVVVDGVMAEAMRAAAAGQTVLVLLDEVLRLSERAQEWLLSFLTGVKTATGRVYRLRTRRAIDGKLEVLEAPVANLHLVAATNLGPRIPVEAFWSRWEVLRLTFDEALIRSTGATIAQSYGMDAAEASALGERFAAAMTLSRASVADGSLRFSLDLRDLERGVQLATTGAAAPTCDEVCRWIGERVADKCAHWSIDLGETDQTVSGAAVGNIKLALRVVV